MKVLWFTWKDSANPRAGGAEFINEEMATRLVNDGHQVTFLVGGYPGCERREQVNGYEVIRLGNRWSVYLQAYRYYRHNLRDRVDIIIEEINTIPFLTQLYAPKVPRVLLIYQLCRQIWFYEMFFPLNVLGYLLEPLYLLMMKGNVCITESNSTRDELLRFGFDAEKTHVFPIGTDMEPIASLEETEKFAEPTLLSLGALRAMKRTVHQIKAFEMARESIEDLRLIVAGGGKGTYKDKVLKAIAYSPYRDDIRYLGAVSEEEKREIMRKSHLILVTSVKEGWGLIVTEAARQGTPAIVYDVTGLRDSVQDGSTGLICAENTPAEMARLIASLWRDRGTYERIRRSAWELASEYSLERSYSVFAAILERSCGDLPR